MSTETNVVNQERLGWIYENIESVHFAMDDVLRSTGDILKLSAAISELANAVSDLSTYHPDYDTDRGAIPRDEF